MSGRTAAIIGGGPAGLTAACEMLASTDIRPIVLEATDDVGGISRTVEVRGNRIDIGGHRFFSKSERVMRWWLSVLPTEAIADAAILEGLVGEEGGRVAGDGQGDRVMLVRHRVSRILYGGRLFDYPLSLSPDTVAKLGIARTAGFGLSYLRARLAPIRPEGSLEDFLINRFGRALYHQFFREYTEKVWGVPCSEISPDWGAQRIKGLSITKVLKHAVKRILPHRGDLAQRNVETSLIERFLYPKLGPGQLWQVVAERIAEKGGEVRLKQRVAGLTHSGDRITALTVLDEATGRRERLEPDFVISTMPVQDLVAGLEPAAPTAVRQIADGLVYRDFRTAGLLLERLELGGGTTAAELAGRVPDNWIYIQEPGVKVGRLQIFNNWSPHMVADPDKILVGLEYFGTAGDSLWEMDDTAFLDLAVDEMEQLGLARRGAVLDRFSVRMPKAYPAYFGSYDRFADVRAYLDGFANLFPVGRNGMHRYNNQDHSMLTAMAAVEAIARGATDKSAIWSINTEQEYHEAKRVLASAAEPKARGRQPVLSA